MKSQRENRRTGQRCQLLEGLVVFAEHRLFDEHQFVGVEFLHQHLGHGLVNPPMEVHANTDIRPHRIAHGGDVGQGQIDLFEAVDELQLFGAIHLHRSETTANRLPGSPGGVSRTVTADPRVHADPVTHLAAEQIADRYSQSLALDIP